MTVSKCCETISSMSLMVYNQRTVGNETNVREQFRDLHQWIEYFNHPSRDLPQNLLQKTIIHCVMDWPSATCFLKVSDLVLIFHYSELDALLDEHQAKMSKEKRFICVQDVLMIFLSLARLQVSVLTLLNSVKHLQNLMKLLPNHIMVWQKIYFKLISDIIVNDYATKKILKSWCTFKNIILFIFYSSVYPLISSTKVVPWPELEQYALIKYLLPRILYILIEKCRSSTQSIDSSLQGSSF